MTIDREMAFRMSSSESSIALSWKADGALGDASRVWSPWRRLALLSALLILMTAFCGCESNPAISTGTAIIDVTVVNVETGVLSPGMTVVFDDNRITTVRCSTALELTGEVEQISGAGKFLIPGLWDMHIHTSGSEQGPRDIDLPLYVATGITGIRFMSGDCDGDCSTAVANGAQSADTVKRWKADIAAGTQVGPRLVASSALFDGPEAAWPGSYMLAAPEEGRAKVREALARGADFVKVYGRLPVDVYYAVVAEAQRVGLDVAGHVPRGVSLSEAAAAGQRSIEHVATTELRACSRWPERAQEARARYIETRNPEDWKAYQQLLIDGFDGAAGVPLFEVLRSNDTFYVPTLVMYRTRAFVDEVVASSAERMSFIPQGRLPDWWSNVEARLRSGSESGFQMVRELFRRRLEFVAAAHRAGVTILAGTDCWNPYVFAGFSLHDELEVFVQAGLTPLAALQTATTNPARYFRMQHELGAVKPGYLADLVLLDGNPLEQIGNTRRISAVVANGRVFDRESLDQLLTNVRSAANSTTVTGRVLPQDGGLETLSGRRVAGQVARTDRGR